MEKEPINIIWIKRDLRTQDHEPLAVAEQQSIPYLILYIFEPSLLAYADNSLRHNQFVYQSILAMNTTLNKANKSVEILYGEALDIFKKLHDTYRIINVLSYQENGTAITWERDKELHRFFKTEDLNWGEYKRGGVDRGRQNRQGWHVQWNKTMNAPLVVNAYDGNRPGIKLSTDFCAEFILPEKTIEKWSACPKEFQPAGERNGWRYLQSFVKERGHQYHKLLSKPSKSRASCSRVSPYLAWGNLSVKQVFQYVSRQPDFNQKKRAHGAFLERILWHCHFIQKFEVECAYETRCINRGFELLEHPKNEDFINAWKTGQTGYPLVDACMRAVCKTGWINFRMRAMLVSFLVFNLDQDWREGVYHLAQQFLDYDPGIHYPQFQMQAGTTGVNMIRLYNPIKQSEDHDPEGAFIKKWVPELIEVPLPFIHEPWKMTGIDQTFCGVEIGKDYPKPIVDLEESAKKAREKVWKHRDHELVIEEKNRILRVHTSRERRASS